MSEDSVEERLVRIETKIDAWIDSSNKRDERDDSRAQDMEQRLRVLERRDAYVLGIGAAISLVAEIVLHKLGF